MIETSEYNLTWFRIPLRPAPAEGLRQESTPYASRAPCTTPGNCGAAAARTTSPRSSPGRPAWPNSLPPPSTAPTSASSPTPPSMSCRCRPRLGATRVGGLELNKPRIRDALSRTGPGHLGTRLHRREFTARVQQLNGHADYTIRQGAYDLPQAPRQEPHIQASRDAPLPHPARRGPHHRGNVQPGGHEHTNLDRPRADRTHPR